MLCAFDGSPAGRGGIAWNDVIVSDSAALDVAFRTPWAVGKNFAARRTVFGGIGINEQGGRAFPLCG